MASIPRSVLDRVTRQVNALSPDAQAKVLRVLESIEWTPDNVAACRELVVRALQSVLPTYTDAAAQAGADMYDAVRTSQVGEAMGATAASGYRPDAVEGAVKALVQQVVDGKPVEQFDRSVLDRVDYEMKRACNVSVAENAARDPLKPRYARVPTGAETCSFCLMLASRGFVYTSREAAGHAHAGCDCRVVPGFPGTKVEGYDPDAYLELWRKSEEMKADKVPVAQRDAVMAAMRDRLLPHYSSTPEKLAEIYQRGVSSAWSEFKKLGKTRDSYEATVGAFLSDMGDASGCDFSADFMARPDGDELWAASKLASEYGNIRFRYAARDTRNPDYLLDGKMAELKTPLSRRKVTNRLVDISEQFVPYPEERKLGIVSTLHLDEEIDYVKDTSQRFVDDGTLDEVIIVRPSGEFIRVR